MNKEQHKEYMRRAIALSIENVRRGGGPFGAVIVKDGKIVGEGTNRVTLDNDPTAHAEVSAIRAAAAQLGTFNLEGCVIYTSCEPCPMCLGAIYWARLDRIYFGSTRYDAAHAGFDDEFLYRELALDVKDRHKVMTELLPDEARKAFELWCRKEDKVEY